MEARSTRVCVRKRSPVGTVFRGVITGGIYLLISLSLPYETIRICSRRLRGLQRPLARGLNTMGSRPSRSSHRSYHTYGAHTHALEIIQKQGAAAAQLRVASA